MKHSPGPWKWQERRGPVAEYPLRKSLVDANGRDVAWGYVATLYDDDLPTGVDAEPADARLIAASPAMRDLLERLLAEATRLSDGDKAEIALLLGAIDAGAL